MIDLVDKQSIISLRRVLNEYKENPEEQGVMTATDNEFNKVFEMIEQHKKSGQNNNQPHVKTVSLLMIDESLWQLEEQQKEIEIRSKVDLDKHTDVVKEYCRVEQIHAGNIVDA